jgi:hypothetical protein
MSFSITAAVSRVVSPRPVSVEARILTTNRATDSVSPKEATQFISETFNKGLTAPEVLTRLVVVRAKLGQAEFESAKEAAKEQNPKVQVSDSAHDNASNRIRTILEPKVLMYSKEYYAERKADCWVSDSPSSSPRTSVSARSSVSSIETPNDHNPYVTGNVNDMCRHYGWPLVG